MNQANCLPLKSSKLKIKKKETVFYCSMKFPVRLMTSTEVVTIRSQVSGALV